MVTTIEFEVLRSEPVGESGISYEFVAPGRPKGEAQVIIRLLDKYKKTKYYQTLLDEGLDPDDTIAHLSHFYPNGMLFNEKYFRKGVGTKALNIIIEDLIDCDAKLILVNAIPYTMKEFLKENGFEPTYQNFYHKKL